MSIASLEPSACRTLSLQRMFVSMSIALAATGCAERRFLTSTTELSVAGSPQEKLTSWQAAEVKDQGGDNGEVIYEAKELSLLKIAYVSTHPSGSYDHSYVLKFGRTYSDVTGRNSKVMIDKTEASLGTAGLELRAGWATTDRRYGFAPIRTTRVRPAIASVGDEDEVNVALSSESRVHQTDKSRRFEKPYIVLAVLHDSKHYIFNAKESQPLEYTADDSSSSTVQLGSGQYAVYTPGATRPWDGPNSLPSTSLKDTRLLFMLQSASEPGKTFVVDP